MKRLRKQRIVGQGKILTEMHRKGALITVEHIAEGLKSSKKVYRLTTGGRAIPAALVKRMLDDGLIQENSDGLPGIGEAQTYSLVKGP